MVNARSIAQQLGIKNICGWANLW